MLAVKQGRGGVAPPLPKIDETTAVKAEDARKLAGKYKSGDKTMELTERYGRLYAFPGAGGFRVELRALGDDLIVDDRLAYGQKVKHDGGRGGVTPPLRINKDVYEKRPNRRSRPRRRRSNAGLIGEYGWDHNTLVILEKDGKLWALIEWFFLYPLEEEKPDVYKFPESGLYLGEKIVFARQGRPGDAGRGGRVPFERRPIQGEDGKTFKIQPVRPVAKLRKALVNVKPPEEKGEFRKPDLVELIKLDDSIKLDIRYASDNNFLARAAVHFREGFYAETGGGGAGALSKKLAEQGYGLVVYDGYRPWSVTKLFWEATPEKFHIFVADPSLGSHHNCGCAVDLTLYDRKTGKPVEMTGGYDEMTGRSYAEYPGGTSLQRWDRGCCGARWRRRGSPSTTRSGGILTIKIGRSIRSARRRSRRSTRANNEGLIMTSHPSPETEMGLALVPCPHGVAETVQRLERCWRPRASASSQRSITPPARARSVWRCGRPCC